jgi:hypothetical protein
MNIYLRGLYFTETLFEGLCLTNFLFEGLLFNSISD